MIAWPYGGYCQRDGPWVLVAGAQHVLWAAAFEHGVAEGAENQGLRYQHGWIVLDEKDGFHGLFAFLPQQ
jgi:hypothetical protein